jgi:hypothetical protein
MERRKGTSPILVGIGDVPFHAPTPQNNDDPASFFNCEASINKVIVIEPQVVLSEQSEECVKERGLVDLVIFCGRMQQNLDAGVKRGIIHLRDIRYRFHLFLPDDYADPHGEKRETHEDHQISIHDLPPGQGFYL